VIFTAERLAELRRGGRSECTENEFGFLLDAAERALPQKPLGKCAACEQGADPRFSRRHPETGEVVFLCDGCPPGPNDDAGHEERLLARIVEKSHEREVAYG